MLLLRGGVGGRSGRVDGAGDGLEICPRLEHDHHSFRILLLHDKSESYTTPPTKYKINSHHTTILLFKESHSWNEFQMNIVIV